MIHHHIKYNNDNVFKSKVAYSSLLYGKVSLSKYILFCKFSFAFRYVMANLMLTFFLYCEYSVQFTDHEVIPSVCVCVCVCVWHMEGTAGYREDYCTAIGRSDRLSY